MGNFRMQKWRLAGPDLVTFAHYDACASRRRRSLVLDCPKYDTNRISFYEAKEPSQPVLKSTPFLSLFWRSVGFPRQFLDAVGLEASFISGKVKLMI
jgi:hypothetical protein